MKTKKTVLLVVVLVIGFFSVPQAQSTGPLPELANYGFFYTDTSLDASLVFKTPSSSPIFSMIRVFEDANWNLVGFRRDTFTIINPPVFQVANNLIPETAYRILLSFSYSPDLWNDSVGINHYEYVITTAQASPTAVADVPDVSPLVWVFEKKLRIQSGTNIQQRIMVYDISGQTVAESMNSETEQTIDLADQPTGMYFVRIADEQNRITTKKILL